VGDGEKLLTHLNSALKVLLGLDSFPRVPKKKLNFVDQCNYRHTEVSYFRKFHQFLHSMSTEMNQILKLPF